MHDRRRDIWGWSVGRHAGGQHVRGTSFTAPCVDWPHNPIFGSQRRLENNGKVERYIGFRLVQDRRRACVGSTSWWEFLFGGKAVPSAILWGAIAGSFLILSPHTTYRRYAVLLQLGYC